MNDIRNLPDGFVFISNVREPSNMSIVIALPQEYVAKIHHWEESHACEMREQWKRDRAGPNPGAVLGGCFMTTISWIVQPSSVGCVLDAKCGCGAVLEDVTEAVDRF